MPGRDQRVLNFQFSNFESSLVRYGGETFRTVEHAYQRAKTNDPYYAELVRTASTPAKAKQLGRRAPLRPDWEDVKYDIMLSLVDQKFRPGTFRWQRLCDTGTETIVEWNDWHDNTWGICVCKSCPGDGQNLLGKALMQIRDEWNAKKESSRSEADSSMETRGDAQSSGTGGSDE